MAELPHNPDAEQALIGAMLLSAVAVEEGLSGVSSTDFHDRRWASVFEAMGRLRAAGQRVDDPVAVAAECARGGRDDLGFDITHAMAACPATSNAERYARLIVDAAGLRRIIGFAAELGEDARSYSVPADELVMSARERLDGLDVSASVAVPDGFAWFEDFFVFAEENPAPWAIPGVIRQNWRIVVVGGEGAGKSVLLRMVALSAGVGRHPFTGKPIEPVRTLLLDFENPDEGIDLICRPMYDIARGSWRDGTCAVWRQPAGIDLRNRRQRIELETVIREARPQVVCLGPAYKTYVPRGVGDDEPAVREVFSVLDDLRIRHNFGLIMEVHAPHGDSGAREMRPKGTTLWMQWPEVGISMDPVRDEEGAFTLGRYRGDRLPNDWPARIERSGHAWPWECTMNGAPVKPASAYRREFEESRF